MIVLHEQPFKSYSIIGVVSVLYVFVLTNWKKNIYRQVISILLGQGLWLGWYWQMEGNKLININFIKVIIINAKTIQSQFHCNKCFSVLAFVFNKTNFINHGRNAFFIREGGVLNYEGKFPPSSIRHWNCDSNKFMFNSVDLNRYTIQLDWWYKGIEKHLSFWYGTN